MIEQLETRSRRNLIVLLVVLLWVISYAALSNYECLVIPLPLTLLGISILLFVAIASCNSRLIRDVLEVALKTGDTLEHVSQAKKSRRIIYLELILYLLEGATIIGFILAWSGCVAEVARQAGTSL